MPSRPLRVLSVLCWCTLFSTGAIVGGCGLGPFAGEGGGDDNLPSRGAGPYRVQAPDFDTPADEPYVVAQNLVSLVDPSVRVLEDGNYEIFYTQIAQSGTGIYSVILESISELPVTAPRLVLAPDSEWEEGEIGAASILVEEDRLILYYRGGAELPAIGRALSTDGGASFVKDPNNPILEAADDPQVVLAGDRYLMVHANPEHRRIYLRSSEDGEQFSAPEEILAARTGSPLAFDRLGVRAPSLVVAEGLDGREQLGVFYTGVSLNRDDEALESIGYIGSFEGQSWRRFLGGEPVLQPGPAGAGGAAPVLGASESLLFFHQPRQGRGRIGVALSP